MTRTPGADSPDAGPKPGDLARITWHDHDDIGRQYERTDDCIRETKWWLTLDEAEWVSDDVVLNRVALVAVEAGRVWGPPLADQLAAAMREQGFQRNNDGRYEAPDMGDLDDIAAALAASVRSGEQQ